MAKIRNPLTISGGITPSGLITITDNGTFDVTDDASAVVNVPKKQAVTWHQCPAAVRNYLANVTYDPSDYTTTQITTYAPATAVTGNTKPIGQTFDGVTYYNEVPNADTPFSSANMAGTVKPLDRLRWINTVAPNVRDLGGWSCDGGTVKYGMLFRGGRIDYPTSDYSVMVGKLGIRQEIDLQHDVVRTVSPLGNDVRYYRALSSIQYTLSPTTVWKEIMGIILDNALYDVPTYFHCYHGSDRTATLACIIEGMLGISQSDIDKEYELSSFYSGTDTAANTRARNESDWTGLITQITALSGSSFRDKCVGFVASLGFSAFQINSFRSAMTNGTPGTAIYGVSKTLTNCSGNNAAHYVLPNQAYTITITADEEYTLTGADVSVTMGGTDITATAYADGVITVSQVTGDIVINITAASYSYTNLIPLSVDTDGSAFGTNGIMYNERWSSSGTHSGSAYLVNSTGLMPMTAGDVIYLQGVGLYHKAIDSTKNSYQRITLFTASKAYSDYVQPFTTTETKFATMFENIVYGDDDEIIQITAKTSGYFAVTAASQSAATAMSVDNYLHDTSIITVNEPIE